VAGVSGKKAVVFFYGADDAPSCKKELAAFDEFMEDFKTLGATVVGVRNAAGAVSRARESNRNPEEHHSHR